MNNITLYKQIHPCQCQTLANLGFKSLVNLRFDNECENQPNTIDIHQSAAQAGIYYQHLPIDGNSLPLDIVQQFAQLLNELPKPVMVFCGTGSRAKRLYQSAIVSGLLSAS